MPNEPLFEQKTGKEFNIEHLLKAPLIDGKLDDPIWGQLKAIDNFIQEDPDNMGEPSEKTEVYLAYDDKSIYIAARLFDSEPQKIVQQLASRDDWYGAFDEMADWFSISFDSRHDHQTGYTFAVNASGVLYDEMVYHDQNYDSDWDAIWDAEIHIDDLGWIVEMEIPFSNLPFYGGQNMVWGLNMTRFIQHKYETISWVSFPLDVEGIVSKYGHLFGLTGIYPPAKFEFKPYYISGLTKYSDIRLLEYDEARSHGLNYKDQWQYDIGLDFLYRINTTSQIIYTFNPDFGQIESDPADVNLTAFETYFREKRPFFMKDIDIFDTPIELFYSRRIGGTAWSAGELIQLDTLDNINQSECDYLGGTYANTQCTYADTSQYDIPVMIKGASKLTGRTKSGFSYGLIGAITTLDDSSSWIDQMQNGNNRGYLVSRFKQDLFSGNSFLGFMSTSSFIDSAHTISIDGMGNFWNNQIGIEGQYIMDANQQNLRGLYASVLIAPPGVFSGWFDYYNYDKDLDINDLGYLWRNDYTQSKFGIKFQSLEPWTMARDFYFIIEGDAEQNANGLDLGKTIQFIADIELSNNWVIGGSYYKIFEHYDDRKIFYDYENEKFGPPIMIPEIEEYTLNIITDKSSKINASISLTWADNILNDKERLQYIELTYKPNTYLSFSTSYDRYRLNKKYHWIESLYDCYETGTILDPVGNCDYHHIFSDLNRQMDIITFRVMGNYNRKVSLQGYFEIYSNRDTFDPDSYLEYLPDSKEYKKTPYVLGQAPWVSDNGIGMPVYTQDMNELESDLSYLDPNLYLGLYPNYTSMILNGIVKWNYMKGSNLYFIYSFNKAINGTPFSTLNQLTDFISFNEKQDWIEVLRNQTFMIKIDYWFEK